MPIFFLITSIVSSANAFNLDQPKILFFGKDLTLYQTKKNLDMTKLKALADDKLNVAKMTISLYDRVKNTVGKG